jgi:ADP-ribosylglycohydrolase
MAASPHDDALTSANPATTDGVPDPGMLNQRLGAGWVGEEALAIAACCALGEPTPRAAMLAAVNHSGDSDSTASITGNLVGARYGSDAVPGEWLDAVEGADVVAQVAQDAATELLSPPWDDDDSVPSDWWHRYPGW